MVNLTKNRMIVRSDEPIGLFGGGYIGSADTDLVLNRVSQVVAADGGASVLIDSGHMPEAVIGDLDSLSPQHRAQIPADRLFHITEQDSTDFEKALRSIHSPLILGAGFLGGRMDHQLAVLSGLLQFQDRPCILLGAQEVIFHAPPRIAFAVDPGETVSLFPLLPVTGRSKGLEWPIDGLQLAPGARVGTSNRAVSDIVLEVDGPGLLVIAPRIALDQVMQAFLSDQTGHWPARAG